MILNEDNFVDMFDGNYALSKEVTAEEKQQILTDQEIADRLRAEIKSCDDFIDCGSAEKPETRRLLRTLRTIQTGKDCET